MMVLIKPSLAPSKASTFHVNLKAGRKSTAVDVHVQLYGEIVFPYVDVLKPCSLEVIWSQSALAISRKSCHPQLLLSWCRLASFSCVRARSNQSPTACLRLSSSTEKNAKLLLRSLWPCVIFLLSSNPDRFVRVYLSGLGGEATGGSGLCKPLRLCSRWGPLNNAEHCWTIVSIKCLVCGELPGVRNTTFPKKSWCVYRSSSDVSGSLRLVVSGFDLLVGRNPAIAHCKFNSSWLPWKVTWWVRNPGKGETSRKLILSCRFHEAEGDTRAWFI